jgi:heat-inducible transcriptional repressor
LGPRERDILAAICREYIISGEAVGSRTLVRRQGIAQSPATVRNVMSDLEERGLLQKPHTSAGRVPTDIGLRFFVDRLMQLRDLSDEERADIRRRYKITDVELQGLMREISRLLSDLSHQCALVLVPRTDVSRLKRVEFVPLRRGKLIAVLVMSSGRVENRLIHVERDLDPDELSRVHHYLNDLCGGHEIAEVRQVVQAALKDAQQQVDTFRSRALKLGSAALAPAEDEVLIGGQSKLLDGPELHDPEQMKAMMRALDDRRVVLRLLDETISAEGVQVFIGAETNEQEMQGYAIVAAAYGGSRPLGTIGVIGPSNMDYPRVLPIVDFTASILTDLLKE